MREDPDDVEAPIRVLFVDDDVSFVTLAATFLERKRESLSVATVSSGNEALERLDEESFDCIVSDYEMPEMDGLELLKSVKREHPDLPAILYTGAESKDVASEAIDQGVTEYLQKRHGTDQYALLENRIVNVVTKHRAERRFEAMFHDSTQLSAVVRPDGEIARLNSAALDLVEEPIDRATGTRFWQLDWWAHEEAVSDCVREAFDRARGGEEVRFETSRSTFDGSVVPIALTLTPVLTGEVSGDVDSIIVRERDIVDRGRSDRKQLEHEQLEHEQLERERLEHNLARAESALEMLFRNVPTSIYEKDDRARHVRISDHMVEQLIGMDYSGSGGCNIEGREDILEKTDAEIYGTGGEKSYEDDLRIIETGEPIHERQRSIREDGRIEWIETEKVPLYDANDDVVGMLGVTYDILEEHRAEQLEQFANVVSHDLRNPLNVAIGRLELAREGGEEHLDEIESALSRMQVLIDDLLTLARHGQSVKEVAPVDVTDVAETAWRQVDTDDAILECGIEKEIYADESRFQQLLENLFRNAIEHGGEDVTVRIGSRRAGFYVEDDGPGIPRDDRDRVFEWGHTTAESGTGYGLAIVGQIAESHGWSVTVIEGTDGGARFEIKDVKRVRRD